MRRRLESSRHNTSCAKNTHVQQGQARFGLLLSTMFIIRGSRVVAGLSMHGSCSVPTRVSRVYDAARDLVLLSIYA